MFYIGPGGGLQATGLWAPGIDLHFWVGLPLDADNSYQNLSAVASFAVFAEQKAHNP